MIALAISTNLKSITIAQPFYMSWRQQYGATFGAPGWSELKKLLTFEQLQKGFIASLVSKTEAEILLESQMKAELEASIKQLKVRAAARFPTETLVDV